MKASDLAQAIEEYVNSGGSWKEKWEALKKACNERDDGTSLCELGSWIADEL